MFGLLVLLFLGSGRILLIKSFVGLACGNVKVSWLLSTFKFVAFFLILILLLPLDGDLDDDLDDEEEAQEALNLINAHLDRLKMYMAEDGGKGQVVICGSGYHSYEGNDLDETVICGNPEVLYIF